jgi:hypothetical protein
VSGGGGMQVCKKCKKCNEKSGRKRMQEMECENVMHEGKGKKEGNRKAKEKKGNGLDRGFMK